MPMTIDVAHMRIVRDLRAAETALDNALLTQSSLLSTMIAARRDTDAEPFEGHEMLMRLTKSQQTLVSAGGELARVHGGLLQVQKTKGIADKCPPNEPMGLQSETKTA